MTAALQSAIASLIGEEVREAESVSGGSINQAAKIFTTGGERYFAKWNAGAPADMFPKEHRGLELLRDAKTGLHIPTVRGSETTQDGIPFLVMEYIPEGTAQKDSAARFGRQLAALHRHTAARHGLDYDNYMGKLPQSNTRHAHWVDFFINERLQPQLRRALDQGKLPARVEEHVHNLCNRLPELLPDEPPSLLHGDLWSGNYLFDAAGEAAIYDPAVHYGSRESELAMTHLFGGFSSDFYAGYQDAYPLQDGFQERKDIYNLYPLLIHANLFGSSYARQVQNIVSRFN